MHYCAYHKRDEPDKNFRLKGKKLDSWCIEGRREYNRKYSEKKYAPIKAGVAEKKTQHEERTEQTCTVCKETKLIDKFPFRYDRPTRRESRCYVCLKQIKQVQQKDDAIKHADKRKISKKHYHDTHPRYNDQSSRRRRARHKQIRTEKYTREEVRERDKGLCWFCKEPVDPNLKWPHPRSEVIHHIHPESKKGPDVLHNVAIAHAQPCNGKHKNKHVSDFTEGWNVAPITNQLARQIAKDKHYLHRAPNTSYAFGLFQDGDNDLQGIVVFGSPSSGRITKSVCSEDVKQVIELNRLWIDDNVPFGAASWLVSRALKQLLPYIVISYADTEITDTRNGRSHDGSIYRALSFNYAGQSKPSKDWRLPGSTRNVGKKTPGSVCFEVAPKNRFWTVTGNKRDKKILRSMCEWSALPYG